MRLLLQYVTEAMDTFQFISLCFERLGWNFRRHDYPFIFSTVSYRV